MSQESMVFWKNVKFTLWNCVRECQEKKVNAIQYVNVVQLLVQGKA